MLIPMSMSIIREIIMVVRGFAGLRVSTRMKASNQLRRRSNGRRRRRDREWREWRECKGRNGGGGNQRECTLIPIHSIYTNGTRIWQRGSMNINAIERPRGIRIDALI